MAAAIKTDPTFCQHAGDPAVLGGLLGGDGVIRTGHFRLLSGLHTAHFLAFSEIAQEPTNLDLIASWIGPTIESWRPTAVLSPSTAGVGLAATLARRLSAPLHLASTGDDGRPSFVVGDDLSPDGRVLLVNDVTTTGTALRALAALAEQSGARVAGAAWFMSRGPARADLSLGFPSVCVGDVDLPSWAAEVCELCVNDVPSEDARDLN